MREGGNRRSVQRTRGLYGAVETLTATQRQGLRQTADLDGLADCRSRWRPDGKEIFYIGSGWALTVVEVSAKGAMLEIREAHPLFGPLLAVGEFSYDVSADGQRFLAEIPSEVT
jgi:hypothetical protein